MKHKSIHSRNFDSNTKEYHATIESVSVSIPAFFDKTFASRCVDGPAFDPAEVQKSPLMIVSTHRSHVDYFMWGMALFLMGIKNLRFAAGDNLTKLPWIGRKFLAFGAFAVSRGGGFERNYVRNLCAQVVSMLEDGDAVLVFPEGGRSYSGAMLEIKGGVLNAALIAQAADMSRDVFLLPSAISYDCPPDVPWFPLLLKGKNLRKKRGNLLAKILGDIYYFGADAMAFAPFMLARFFGRRYGNVYMDYGEPVSVRELVDLAANRVEGARDEFAAHRKSLDIVGEKIGALFVSLYRILPIHIVSAALNGGAASLSDIETAAQRIKAETVKRGRNCKTIGRMEAKEIVVEGLKSLRKLKAVKIRGDNAVITKPHIVDYFAATC